MKMMETIQKPYKTHDLSLAIPLKNLPVYSYDNFFGHVLQLMKDEEAHCLNYYAFPYQGGLMLPCFIANDREHCVDILAHFVEDISKPLQSLVESCMPMHIFEREISENFGLVFEGHKWLKPVRFPFDRANQGSVPANYPFYTIDGDELHEVGVGPVHAGVIEPGHFRFICNGEKVIHLEIQLGYQHRGIESLMLNTSGLRRALLSECIAGDTAVGHSIAHSGLMETLSGTEVSRVLSTERAIALELERIAVHLGDTAALCTDVAYQLGQVVNESLRTIVINTTQEWCGNRFGKGMVRPDGTRYPLNPQLLKTILNNLNNVMNRFHTIAGRIFSMPSVLSRFDGIGTVTKEQLLDIGAVGMAARMGGLCRDIRFSHPTNVYNEIIQNPLVLESGDVLARALLRVKEIENSVKLIQKLIQIRQGQNVMPGIPEYDKQLIPGSIAISITEGWRGEICHSAVTGDDGSIIHYKIKDPSLHNWTALALAVRNQEISDFPVCNKSFNLSYCGNDL